MRPMEASMIRLSRHPTSEYLGHRINWHYDLFASDHVELRFLSKRGHKERVNKMGNVE